MAHQYSVEIHGFLTSKQQAAEELLKDADAKGEAERSAYFRGRLKELKSIRKLLSAKYDLRFHKYFEPDGAAPEPDEVP